MKLEVDSVRIIEKIRRVKKVMSVAGRAEETKRERTTNCTDEKNNKNVEGGKKRMRCKEKRD